jgi:hypothetical protein
MSSDWIFERVIFFFFFRLWGCLVRDSRIKSWPCLLPFKLVETRMVMLVLQVIFLSQLIEENVN